MAMVMNRARASVADARVRGCHSCHWSPSHRRLHSCTRMSASGVCQASGSPLVSSKRPPSCTACNSVPAVAVGLDPSAERLTAVAAVDGVAHHPRQLRLGGRTAILNPGDLDHLHRSDHHASPPAICPSLTGRDRQLWEGCGKRLATMPCSPGLTWANSCPDIRFPKPCVAGSNPAGGARRSSSEALEFSGRRCDRDAW